MSTVTLPQAPIELYTLGNGLRVVLSEDHSVPVVSVAVYYDVGSRNEREGRTGFAHLFEHMMFQGSENVPKAGHFQYIFNNGGTMNGTTSSERTNYFETLPSSMRKAAASARLRKTPAETSWSRWSCASCETLTATT